MTKKQVILSSIFEWVMALILLCVAVGLPFFFIYKLFSGIFYLLDKLIDKI